MPSQQQQWKYKIKGEVLAGDRTFHLHPENFINLIRISNYESRIMPIILCRLNIDKNLMDFIINNAEEIEIQLQIFKFTVGLDDPLNQSAAVEYINDIFLVSVGSDINYNKEIDYAENKTSEIPIQDKFKETYIGLTSKSCLDANKIVANEVSHQTLMQDLVLSYLLQNCHLLIEPFHHNEMNSNLIIPPLDTMSSVIEYLNSIKVFYETNYILFFDEPYVTYLISKSGYGTKMKGEKYNVVNIQMRSSKDSHNLVIGMNANPDTQSFDVDVSILDSNYNIDQDTAKVVDAIDTVTNPSIDKSKITNSNIANMRNSLQNTMKSFLGNVSTKSFNTKNIGTKLSQMVPQMNFSVDSIGNAAKNMVSNSAISGNVYACTNKAVASASNTVQAKFSSMLNSLPQTITKTLSSGQQVTTSFMSATQLSIQKSMADSRFMACDTALANQNDVKSAFSKAIEQTADQHYKQDFLDNNISAVTFVNFQDVSGNAVSKINSMASGTVKALENMASTVTSKMGNFDNFTNTTGALGSQVSGLIGQLKSAISSSSRGGSGSMSSASGPLGQALKQALDVQDNLTTIKGVADEFGGLANLQHSSGQNAQSNLKADVNSLSSFIGTLSSAGGNDVKSQIISHLPTRIFGKASLAIDQMISTGASAMQGIANTWGNLSANIKGTLNFSDLSNLASNVMKFDLNSAGSMLNHFNFNLNMGKKSSPGIGQTTGTKIVKVKNDNVNQAKNIKSEIELSKNKLSVNKYGLDASVFTPNKQYIIKNYSGHSSKDGRFILNEKVEVFTREDDNFICNLQLFFSKIMENTSTGDARDVSTPNPNRT